MVNGRDGEWDKRLGLGNSAADKSVKDYLRLITQLSSHLDTILASTHKPIDRFIVSRDQAYFKMAHGKSKFQKFYDSKRRWIFIQSCGGKDSTRWR